MKNLLWAVLAVLLIGGGFYFLNNNKGSNQDLIIGGLLPLTGDFADLGEEVNKGAIIAAEEAKKQGLQVNYIAEDDALSPRLGATAAQKLITVDKIDVALTMIGEESKPVTNIFNNANIPLLLTWDSNEEIKKAGKNIFTIGFSSEENGLLMGEFAYDKLSLKKVTILSMIDPVAPFLVGGFKQAYLGRGGVITDVLEVQPDSQDFKTVITKIKSQNPDGIYILLYPPQHTTFLPQLRQAGFNKPVMAVDSFIQSEIDGAGTAAEGVYFTKTFTNNEEKIIDLYTKRFGQAPNDPVLVSFGYDGVRTIVEAFKISSKDNLSIREALTKVKFDSLGTSVDMKGGQFSDRVEKIYQVKNGKSVEVK